MFKHSVKVPRLYKVAATIAKEVSEGLGSIKQLVYEKQKKHPNIKAMYALVATLFQKNEELDTILKRSQFLTKESRLDIWLAKILIVELIWGRKKLPGQSKPESSVRAYEQIFKAHLSDDKTNTTESVDVQAKLKPRYVRVNTLLLTLNEAIEGFRDEGWVLSNFLDKTDYNGFLNKITSLNEDEFLIDIHIPNLLIFPPKTQFYNHPAYKNGSIILQDKASCLPVHILGPTPGSKVLDMCAAPGMKTTHIAAVLNDEGTVYAVERDPRRFETLNKIIESSGARCIQSYNKDVLTCTTEEFAELEYILVDPSCSGSGMTDRLESQVKEGQNRLEKLTGFQIKILRSALTKFPDVKKVVYSTCSVYPEENEDVVRQVLETNYNFKLVPANQYVGETWHNLGSPEYGDIGKFCLYAKPNEDFTNGFFVAVFERLKEGEENQFFNTRIFNFKKHIQAREKRREKKRQLEGATENVENNHPHEENVEEVEEYSSRQQKKKMKRPKKEQDESNVDLVNTQHIQDFNEPKRNEINPGESVIEDNGDLKTEIEIGKKYKKKVQGNTEEPQKKIKKKKAKEETNDSVNNQHIQDTSEHRRREKNLGELVIRDNGDTETDIEIEIRKKHKKKLERNTEEPRKKNKKKRAKKEQEELNDDSEINQHTQDINDLKRKENNLEELVIEDNEDTKTDIKTRKKHKKKHREREEIGIAEVNEELRRERPRVTEGETSSQKGENTTKKKKRQDKK